MGPGNTIEEACVKYIQAVFRAKQAAETADDFWGNRRADRAYRRLFKAIADNTPPDLKWQSAMWEIAGSTAERVWEQDVDEQTYIRGFCRIVNECLDDLAAADWIACVPLEHVFCNFPEFTSFGEFSLVNPGANPEQPVDELLGRFRSILTTNFGVNFMPHTEVNDSYLWLGDHYHQKSGHYIPGRPQLIVKVGRGERFLNERLFWELAANQLALLSLCQIAYELEGGLETRIVSPGHDRLPRGERMQWGLIEIPGVAVAINVRSGEAAWWSTGLRLHETKAGTGYKPDKFCAIWAEVAAPILNLRNAGLSGMMREAIDNAIRLMAKCRHSEMGDLTLYSIIATETILNPFNALGDTSERFAIFAASLTESRAELRLEAYRAARNLYRLRSQAVHQSRLHADRDVAEARKQAFKLFLACLRAVTTWAAQTLAQGRACGPDEFKEFYARTIFSLPGSST
jgi:hypothetical protein